MLCAASPVEINELLDLGFLFACGRFIDRELDVQVTVGHDLAHQGCVFS